MEIDPTLLDSLDTDDMCLEKVLAMTESLDPGLGYVLKSKVSAAPTVTSVCGARGQFLKH